MKNRTLLILFLTAFIIGLLAFAPATLIEGPANRAMAPHAALSVSGGTIWFGNGTLLLFPTARPVSVPISWRFDPLALWRLRVGYYLQANSASIAGNTRIGAGFGSIQLRDMALKIDTVLISRFHPLVSLLDPRGTLRININNDDSITSPYQLQHDIPSAEGKLIVQIDSLILPSLSPRPLGIYEIAIKFDHTRAEFAFNRATGQLKLDGGGTVAWGNPRTFAYQGMANAPRDQAQLWSQLSAVGKPTADGRLKIDVNSKW